MKLNLASICQYLLPVAIFLPSIPIFRPVHKSTLQTRNDLLEQSIDAGNRIGIFEQLGGLVIWGSIYFIALLLVIKVYRPLLKKNKSIYLVFALMTLPSTISIFFSDNLLATLTICIHLIGLASLALAFAFLLQHKRDKILDAFQIMAIFCFLGHIIFSVILPEFSYSYSGRFKGAAENANSLARLGLITFIISFGIKRNSRRLLLNYLAISLSAFILIMTMSMTSIICAVVGVLLIFIFRKFSILYRNLGLFFCVLIFLSPLFFGIYYLVFEQFVGSVGKDNSLTGRSLIWLIGLEAVIEKPFLGWGFGNLSNLREEKMFIVSSFHNGFIDIFVKGGVFVFISFFVIFLRYLSTIKKFKHIDFPFLTSFGLIFILYNLTESTIYSPKNSMWLVFCALVFYSLNLQQTKLFKK